MVRYIGVSAIERLVRNVGKVEFIAALADEIEADCPGKTELHSEILQLPAVHIVVEYEPQPRVEGEIQQERMHRDIDLIPMLPDLKDLYGGTLGKTTRRPLARIRSAG